MYNTVYPLIMNTFTYILKLSVITNLELAGPFNRRWINVV